MIQVTSTEIMQKSDQYTIKTKIPSKELMYFAGTKVFENLNIYSSSAIVCGTGNNAGDGYVIALKLKEIGLNVKLFLVKDKFTDEGKYFFDKCVKSNIPYEIISENSNIDDFDVIIDCLLGTGFKGQLSNEIDFAINKINKSKGYKISVDINSGLNGDNGHCENAVVSNQTISIGNYKSGHFLNSAKDYIGILQNVDIGVELIEKSYYLYESSDAKNIFNIRKNNSNKATFGYSSILGGSLNYSGAVKLANLSLCSLLCGAGLSNVIVPDSLANAILPYILESTLSLIDTCQGEMIFDEEKIDLALKKTTSLLIGVGWGISLEKQKILRYILNNFTFPVIIDADGINNLAALGIDILKTSKAKIILTPHILEFSRLSGFSKEEILNNPIPLSKIFAKEYNVIVLLKGTSTIITNGDDVILTNTGCAGMAKGGSGDVLGGIICGINAFSKNNLLSNVACGAFINGKAGEIAQTKSNVYSALPRDTISCIPDAINLFTK